MEEYRIFKNNATKWIVGVLAGLLLVFVVLFSEQIGAVLETFTGQAQEQVKTLKIGTEGTPWDSQSVEEDKTNIDNRALSNEGVLKIDFSES